VAEFSIQDAAFAGFRVVRGHPAALGVWAAFGLVVSLVTNTVAVALIGPQLQALVQALSQSPPDGAALLSLSSQMAPGYLLIMPISLVFNAVLTAGMMRAVLHPIDSRFGYLRLGSDELRQLGLGLLSVLVFLGVYFGLIVVVAVVAGLASVANKAVGILVAVLGVISAVVALTVLAVRLSLAPALTFDSRRINLFGSWALTRGRFWPVLGTYVLAIVLVAMISFLTTLVFLALGAILNGGDLATALPQANMGSLKAFFTPIQIARLALDACAAALIWPVMLTPPAAIFQRLAPSPRDTAAAFS
jgi:hypothetical protein